MSTIIDNQALITYQYNEVKGNVISNRVETIVLDEYVINGNIQPLKKTFKPGDYVTYVCLIENTGHGVLNRVTIKDNLGNQCLKYVYDTVQLYYNSTAIAAVPLVEENQMSIYLPFTFHQNDKVILIYQAQVNPNLEENIQMIKTTQSVQAMTLDHRTINAKPPPTSTIKKQEDVEITMIKSVDKNEVIIGQPLTYTITLTNTGTKEVGESIVEDKLPKGFVIDKIISTTEDQITAYRPDEYTLQQDTNILTLPNETGRKLSIPASSISQAGKSTVIITGYMTI